MTNAELEPRIARGRFRAGAWTGPTSGFCRDHIQANVVIVSTRVADAFAEFCKANPAPCPLLERLVPGDPEPKRSAPGADLRTDLPRYRVHRAGGASEERFEITDLWTDDLVGFLLGCSFSAEGALIRAGIMPRYVEQGTNVPMFRTNRLTTPAAPFGGPLVVSYRPILAAQADLAAEVTGRYPLAHGAPVHRGEPGALGIPDLSRPDWGDPSPIDADEVPMFWACGVTSQVAVRRAIDAGAISWAITHAPGHMLITDLSAEVGSVGAAS